MAEDIRYCLYYICGDYLGKIMMTHINSDTYHFQTVVFPFGEVSSSMHCVKGLAMLSWTGCGHIFTVQVNTFLFAIMQKEDVV